MKAIKGLFNNTAFAILITIVYMISVAWAADTAINSRGGAGVVADGDSVPIYDTSATAGATVTFANIWTWIMTKAGITNNALVLVDDSDAADGNVAVFTASGIEGVTTLTGLNFGGFSTTAGTVPVTDASGYLQDSYVILAGPTSAHIYTLPDVAGTVALTTGAQTFEDKTIDGDDNTVQDLPITALKDAVEDVAGMNAGTATNQYVTADAVAGSYAGTKDCGWTICDSDESVTAADGKQAFVVPASWNGMNLVNVIAGGCSEKGVTGALSIDVRRVRVGSRMGDDTSQFDLTDQTGDVCRITWDGTGTDPSIADSDASLRVGDVVDISGFTTSANDGHFTLTTVATNYIQFTNASLSAENDQTSVTITPIRHRNMLSTAVTVGDEYSASDETIDTGNDDLATNDLIYIDRTAIHSGTAQKGLSVTIEARLP